ncbi:flagellar motor protein MotB [Pontiellaceae bacterium B1224]|nr:flagellar motor protein MotB [Pontiellaceae bacterium B1224]
MRERPEPDQEGCPLWMLTFGDAMSLLVAFFVMLVSFADFEEHSLQNMMGALKGGLRAVPLPMATTVGRVDTQTETEASEDVISKNASAAAVESSQEVLRNNPARNIIKSNSPDYYLHLLKNGISLVIKRNSAFESGTVELRVPDHEVWLVAGDLMHSVQGEIRIAVTLPENVLVRLDGYTTSWGLGIEQALAVQELLCRNGGDRSQISTSVRVVKNMPHGEAVDGTVEIRFIGINELKLNTMPRKILRGIWRDQGGTEQGEQDGQEG